MTALTFDPTVLVNLVLSIVIVILSFWGYVRIGKPTPLYFGSAYLLFAVSHLLLLFTLQASFGFFLVPLRTAGYFCVAIGLFALITDILKRKDVEKALRESEDRLSATFEQAAVGIAEILPDASISRFNSRFSEILGYTYNELSVRELRDLIVPEGQADHLDHVTRVISGDHVPGYSAEMKMQKKNGRIVWCQVFLSPVRDPQGTPKYSILVLEDITARKSAEEELFVLNASLEDRIVGRTADLVSLNESLVEEVDNRARAEGCLRDTLREREVLLREIHHRVKNNLQIIVSLLYLQAQKTRDPASSDALLDSQSRIQSMALIHQKLYQSGDLASVDFDGYLKNLVASLMTSYGADPARIKIVVDTKNPAITINSAIPLGLIMNELVSNSLKYAFPDTASGEIAIRCHDEGDNLVFTVRDNGRGIADSVDWITTDSLGLHLVRMLTRQLRGTISLSRLNGTEFILSIPRDERRLPV